MHGFPLDFFALAPLNYRAVCEKNGLEIGMRLDHRNPMYRKVIVPWWDSEIACLLVIISMFVVFLFGMMGVSVAHGSLEYRPFVWVPVLVIMLSAFVILSTTIRLIRRYLSEKRKS